MSNIIITVDLEGSKVEELKAKLLVTTLEYDGDAIIEVEGREDEDENEDEVTD